MQRKVLASSHQHLMAKAPERLHSIAAEDLAPWTKLGFIVFRASEVTHAENKIAVKARIQSDEVAHALEAMAPLDSGSTLTQIMETIFAESTFQRIPAKQDHPVQALLFERAHFTRLL